MPKDLSLIASKIREYEARLLIVDPLMAFLCGADANKDQEVRRVLYKLSKISEKYRCATIAMRHLNKSGTGKAIYRGNSSIGVIGHSRTGLIVAVDPDDDHKRVFAASKVNCGSLPKALRYVLEPVGDVCRVGWCGSSDYTADELVSQPSKEESQQREESASKVDTAKQILEALLATGPKEIKVCKRDCPDAGLAYRTVERAAKKLGLTMSMETIPGTTTKYYWSLPGALPQ